MKYGLSFLMLSAVLLLALTDPENPRRDPVPAEQIVAHSVHCAGCHGYDQTEASLVDEVGNDVNIYDDWQVSMMGFASKDPFWRATLKHETNVFPSAKAEIESTCLKCHAPLGSYQRRYDGLPYSYEDMLADSLGLDGVSCSACHLQPPETYGKSHSGNFILNDERVLYGPHPNPFEGPMELYVGFKPQYTDLMYSSGICAGCHTLITSTLDETGTPTGNMFVEQATYHEWVNSSYPLQGIECQNCHMPFLEDSVLIASGLKGLEKRSPFGLHQFYGANTPMLSMMYAHRDTLGLSDTIPDKAWEETIGNNRMSLRNAAEVVVSAFNVVDDILVLEVVVKNKTGHKFPSGYPSRVAWLQVVLLDDLTGDTLYQNGMVDSEGHIIGRDFPHEPHHTVSLSSEDVQIYEMAMSDNAGHLTTRLNAAHQPLKDNRLLPKGYKRNHAVYDTVAVWGSALDDPDYDVLSTLGQDNIEYRIPLAGHDGIADLNIAVRYHTFPSRWMEDLFESEDIAEVAHFKSMYSDYRTFYELIDSIDVQDIDLGTSVTKNEIDDAIDVFPNPVVSGLLHFSLPSSVSNASTMTYQIIDIQGRVVQSGKLSTQIVLNEDISKGMHTLILNEGHLVAGLYRIIIL